MDGVKQQEAQQRDGTRLFFKRWLRHPLRLGAVLPSSKALTTLISKHTIVDEDSIVVELGGGTGTVTRQLLASGIPPKKLYVLELDPELCTYLRQAFPDTNVILGNATDLEHLLPQEYLGKVASVISGMPITNMSSELQKKIIDVSFKVLRPDGHFLQYTYRPLSPIPAARLGLSKQRVGFAFRNLPPATVWRYQRIVAV